MNRLLRLPAFSIAAATLVTALFGAASLTGCATDCKEVDGKTVCEAESLTQYRGQTVNLPAITTYTPNTATRLRVNVQGGNVRLGSNAQASITVQGGAPAGTITVACVPIVAMKSDEKAEAEKQMAERVKCTALHDTAANEIRVDVFREGERDSSLTAQLLIGVPDDFSGPVTAATEAGDVSLAGVRGAIDARITGIGNLGVYPASPILATDPGNLYVNHGDATLTIPAGSALTISAVSDDLSAVNNNTGFPAVEGSTAIAQTIVVNGGGQTWNVRTDFGSSLLQSQLGFRARATLFQERDGLGNTGEFRIRLAPGFRTGYTRKFGRLDDIPAIADYDGRADLGFYRPGEGGMGSAGDYSTWHWCPSSGSSTPPSCETSGESTYAWGTREDIPLPGLAMGTLPTLTVYRPSNGTFYWSAPSIGSFNARQVTPLVDPPPAYAFPASPMPGLYDADGLTDLVTYEPVNARFDIALSTAGWSVAYADKRIRTFPGSLRPDYWVGDGTLQERAGGIPVGGVRIRLPGGQFRSALAVYDAASQQHFVQWDALTSPGSPPANVVACTSASGAIPIGGLSASPAPYDTIGSISFAVPGAPTAVGFQLTTGPCVGTSATITPFTAGTEFGDATAAVIPDVSGDGAPDILFQNPDEGRVRIIQSDAGFTTSVDVNMGGPYSQMQ